MVILASLLINGMAVFVTAYVLEGIKVDSFATALIVGIVLGVVNTFLRPILLFLTLPFNVLTLGLFTFILNGLMVVITSNLVPGFYVEGLWWAIVFSLVLTLVSWFLNNLKG